MDNYKDITVVIPTINEEGTIGKLAKALTSSYSGIHVLVVDDGSTDGTHEVVRKIWAKNRNVRLYDRKAARKPKGLAYSMMDGMEHATTRFVIFMDGDLQHPPELVGRMAKLLHQGSPIVVATRTKTYNPVRYRAAISSVFSAIGHVVLYVQGSATTHDIFSGYFGLEKGFSEKLIYRNKQRFVGEGYKFLFDLLKCIRNGNVSISEVPYLFRRREYGSSKAEVRQGIALIKSFIT